MREISNHKKADLEKVLCDLQICGKRGDIARCYIEVGEGTYKDCSIRRRYKEYRRRENENREV